jgi:hypothetical protein
MKQIVSVFKIRIDSIEKYAIGFELFAGEKVKDTYVNVLAKGGYGTRNRLLLTPKQFADLAMRLIAYVYVDPNRAISDRELEILWDLRLNIFDTEAQQISTSIFTKYKSRLTNLIRR